MAERLHFHFSLLCIGEGNGNSLQCSCLENPRDGVAQSRTRLKRLSSSSSKDQFQCHLSEDAVLFYSGFDCKYSDLGSVDYNYECRKSCLLVINFLDTKGNDNNGFW